MRDLTLITTGATHQLYRALLRLAGRADAAPSDGADRDRGAVSLEQVLWFVAAGVSVVVIATILWNKIRDEANKPVDPPVAPTP